MSLTYTIGTLSSITGLSHHTIRAWERRYGALSPGRSNTNRRIYSWDDLERITLLKRVVESGHSIGRVAILSTDELRSMDTGCSDQRVNAPSNALSSEPIPHLRVCIEAVKKLEPEALADCLVRGAVLLGVPGLLNGVVIPLLQYIESEWTAGVLGVFQEHMASAVLRTYLDGVRMSMPGPHMAPKLIVTTLRNQLHELGALMVAISAATLGWRVIYLGPNLPVSEIVDAAHHGAVRAVALSIVFPTDDAGLPDELRKLRAELDPSVQIVAGGRATDDYAIALQEIGAYVTQDIWSFRDYLKTTTHPQTT